MAVMKQFPMMPMRHSIPQSTKAKPVLNLEASLSVAPVVTIAILSDLDFQVLHQELETSVQSSNTSLNVILIFPLLLMAIFNFSSFACHMIAS
jgi:hypothetical protein